MNGKIIVLLILLPFGCYSQKKSDTYIVKNERDLKKFAYSQYLGYQISRTDTGYIRGDIDPFATEFFNSSNYQHQALLTIMEFTEKMAREEYRAAGLNKCYCYETALDFYNGRKLDSVVKSVRKYLEPKHNR